MYTAVSFALYLSGVPYANALVPALVTTVASMAAGIGILHVARRRDTPVDGGSPAIITVGVGLAVAQMCITIWMALHSLLRDVDAWLVWGFKARLFALGNPPAGYFHHLAWPMHPDYPLNLPLVEALFLRLPDPFGLHLAALVSTAFLGSLLLLYYAGLGRLYGRDMAAVATGALAAVPSLSQWSARAYADVPVAMYSGAAALYLILWWRLRRPIDLFLAGLLVGGAAWTKKEGFPVALLLLLTCGAAELLSGDAPLARRAINILSVGVAAMALPLPWFIFTQTTRPLGGDFLPLTFAVFTAHASRLFHILQLFGQETLSVDHWSLFWITLGAIVVIALPRLSRHGRVLLTLLVAQLSVYLLGYVFSDWSSYTWHIHTSLDRLMTQAVPLGLLLIVEAVESLAPAGVTHQWYSRRGHVLEG
jgi:hypothetical protein